MTKVLPLQDIKLRFCNKYSGNNFISYADYLKHKLRLQNGEVSPYLTFETCTERDAGALKESVLEERRKKSYQNKRLLAAPEQFICMGRAFPFSIYWSNGRPHTSSSLETFENEQMIKLIRKNDWISFGESSLSADVFAFDYSYNLFMRLQEERSPERTDRIKLLMKDPLCAAVIGIYEADQKPEILTDYKEVDFKDTGCAPKFIENKYGLDSTTASQLATRFKKILFS